MPTNVCQACGQPFEAARKDRRWCTALCKQELKRRYDHARYPDIADAAIERACAWQRDNRERKSAYDAKRRLLKRDEIRARKREAARLRPPSAEERRLAAGKRRARRRKNGAFVVTRRDLRRSYERHRRCCAHCGDPLPWADIEWDHVVPISRGGSHSIGNLVPSCRDCNRQKGWKFVTEWRIGKVVSQYGLAS